MMSLKCFSITSELPVSDLKCTKKVIFFEKTLAGFRKMPTFATAIERESNYTNIHLGALVQLVRIHACHAWGHGFESRTHRNKH